MYVETQHSLISCTTCYIEFIWEGFLNSSQQRLLRPYLQPCICMAACKGLRKLIIPGITSPDLLLLKLVNQYSSHPLAVQHEMVSWLNGAKINKQIQKQGRAIHCIQAIWLSSLLSDLCIDIVQNLSSTVLLLCWYLLNGKVPCDCFNVFFCASKYGNMVVLHSWWFFKSWCNLKV